MIYAGQKYRITRPVSEQHIVGVGDIITISQITRKRHSFYGYFC
ncbi:hypothetical protein phiAS4_ORF0186 [Aeromonas phage phiAS4]|uniref:Uncharacterized protein n=1 Tax=Aeromonas phage phiAS4 TaxID=879628 RepID=E1A1N4_9CAUD|nr:hypothetical protein phiAS4_ORF0186 [Aeromonas phage phiAS4]ADM79758.1 hypothetical protein phiAS4_ORF0186 [Aeromonas phage phiAS4]